MSGVQSATERAVWAFVDTSAWCAFLNARDVNHAIAVEALRGKPRQHLFTTRYCVEEVSRLSSLFAEREIACAFAWSLWNGELAVMVDPGEAVEEEAWVEFEFSLLGGISYVDYVSSAVIRSLRIERVFSFGDTLQRLVATG